MADECNRVTAVTGIGGTPSDSGHSNDQLVLFGLAFVMIGGAFIKASTAHIPLPYTALLLIFGCSMAMWVLFDQQFTLQPGTQAGGYAYVDEDGGHHVLQCNVTQRIPNDLHFHGWHLGNALRLLATLDSHLLLNALLPPLLFESAFAIDWHIFGNLSGYAILLAAPGIAVASTLTAVVYGFMYGWRWEACVLIGAILSATDPVAVVALLREMGVKKSLATLIEAESLMNDGTAVVAFTVFQKAVRAGSLTDWLDAEGSGTWDHLLWVTVRMSFFGPLWGIANAIATLLFLSQVQGESRDPDIEVIMTLAMPFFVYYVGETAFGDGGQLSGVLAVVAFGLTFASPWGKLSSRDLPGRSLAITQPLRGRSLVFSLAVPWLFPGRSLTVPWPFPGRYLAVIWPLPLAGKTHLDPTLEHFLHRFWGMVGTIANTLIFCIAGLTIIIQVTAGNGVSNGVSNGG